MADHSRQETPEHREKRLERKRVRGKQRYAEHRDEINARKRARRSRWEVWYEANAEKVRAYSKAYYQAHKEEQRARQKLRNAALRQGVIEHYGGKCACCGETEVQFLTIDHVNGGGTEHRKMIARGRARNGKDIYYWLRDNDYPEGFQVLCFNCNMAKGLYGACPHQRTKE